MTNDVDDTEVPSQIAHLFTPEEGEELGGLMISFDGGMLDFGELDGFLSALAVAPQPTTLDRWWPTLFGPEPDWETDEDPLRAKALIERYYVMVQARVAISPFELGEDAVLPLWSMTDLDEDALVMRYLGHRLACPTYYLSSLDHRHGLTVLFAMLARYRILRARGLEPLPSIRELDCTFIHGGAASALYCAKAAKRLPSQWSSTESTFVPWRAMASLACTVHPAC